MNKFIKTIVAVSAATMMLAVVAVPAPAQAQTIAELQAQISALMAQISALTGSTTTGGSSYTFTRDLTIGSSGTDVMELQKFLNGKGFTVNASGAGSPGQESTYFGSLTAAALAKYQAANNIAPAAGYFGPMTRANVNATGGSTTPDGDDDDSDTGSDDLEGGAGSVDSYDEISGINNEEVGEDEEDVVVAGLEVEVDEGSDIEITAVKLDFATQPSNDDLDEFITDVSIWLDGEEVARVDADSFNDDNDWTKTVTLESGAIIRAEDTADLEIAVSGVSNIDSDDASDTWGVDITQVRFKDAQDSSITDTVTADEFSFSVVDFATAADVELKANIGDDSPDSVPVDVDDSDDTDNVELLQFTLEAEGSDIEIKDLPITLTVTGATDVDFVANTLTLEIDGEEYSENISTATLTTATVTFDDVDFTISEGEEVTVIVRADINNLDANFEEGDTIKAEYTASNRNGVDAEDETGEDLAAVDKTGTALGNVIAFYDTGIQVSLVSVTEETIGQDSASNDTGQFIIKYEVTALDGDIYVADTATVTTATDITAATVASNQVLYRVDRSGSATTVGLDAVVSFTSDGTRVTDSGVTNGVKITDGSTGEFTLTVNRTNGTGALQTGSFRTALKGISWATSDTATQNVFDFDLEDFETEYTFID